MTTLINADTVVGGAVITGDTSGELGLQAGGSTKLTVTGSGVTLATPLAITSGGTGSSSTTFVNLATNVTGTLPVANGGTGATSLSGITVGTATNATTATNLAGGGAGQVPYNTGAGATTFLAAGTSGQVLRSGGTGAPTWGAVSVGAGGTGQTSLTANNVILGNGTSAVQFVAPGTNGNVLTSNGTTWQSSPISAGGLTLIGSLTLTNSSQSINLPANWNTTYKYLQLITQGSYQVPSGTGAFLMRFNNSSAAAYSYSWVRWNSGTNQSGQTFIQLGTLGQGDGFLADFKIIYAANAPAIYRVQMTGTMNVNAVAHAAGAFFDTSSVPSTIDFPLAFGSGYYLSGTVSVYGAS